MKTPSRAKFGGFTLIELLVVVLIIGILAAIALPQYQMAVERSHIAEANIVLKSLADSVGRYYLEAGDLHLSEDMWSKLDISLNMPLADDYYVVQGKHFWYSLEDNCCSIFAGTGTYGEDSDYFLTYQFKQSWNPASGYDRLCRGDTEWGAKVCSAVCGTSVATDQECRY